MLEIIIWALLWFIVGFISGYTVKFLIHYYTDVQYIITILKEDILNLTIKCERILNSFATKV